VSLGDKGMSHIAGWWFTEEKEKQILLIIIENPVAMIRGQHKQTTFSVAPLLDTSPDPTWPVCTKLVGSPIILLSILRLLYNEINS